MDDCRIRYSCMRCTNYDLCERCEAKGNFGCWSSIVDYAVLFCEFLGVLPLSMFYVFVSGMHDLGHGMIKTYYPAPLVRIPTVPHFPWPHGCKPPSNPNAYI